MKRRIILILVIVAVLGLIAGGIAWYLRANSGAAGHAGREIR